MICFPGVGEVGIDSLPYLRLFFLLLVHLE